MASTRFLDRSARVLWARVQEVRRAERRGLRRLRDMAGALGLAVAAFFVLKGVAIAAGAGLPGGSGAALWLSGPDPVASTLGVALEPVFAGRG